MTFDSHLAMFTTLFGWSFYNAVWDILVLTGLAFVPFGIVFFNAFKDGHERGGSEGGALSVLPSIEMQLFIMGFVILVAAMPTSLTALSPGSMSVRPYARTITNPSPASETPQTTSTTYNEAFGCPGTAGGTEDCATGSSIPVPAFWYGVMATSEGITRATINRLPPIQGLRDFRDASRLLNIEDSAVRQEANLFFSHCYTRARSLYDQLQLTDIPTDEMWLAHQFFLTDPRFYPEMRARQPIPGFAYDDTRDHEYDGAPADAGNAGKPYCNQWYEGASGNPGLRSRLLTQVTGSAGANIIDQARAALPDWLTDDVRAEDVAIRSLLVKNPLSFTDDQITSARRDISSPITDFARANNLAFGRQDIQSTSDIVVIGAPMLQSIIRLGVYGMLVFLVVGSGYNITSLVNGSVFVFVLCFWSALFHMALWVEEGLMQAFWPGEGRIGALFDDYVANNARRVGTWFGIAQQPAPVGATTKLTMLNVILSACYVIFPFLFTVILGAAGLRAAGALQNAMIASAASTTGAVAPGVAKGTRMLPGGGGRGGRGSGRSTRAIASTARAITDQSKKA